MPVQRLHLEGPRQDAPCREAPRSDPPRPVTQSLPSDALCFQSGRARWLAWSTLDSAGGRCNSLPVLSSLVKLARNALVRYARVDVQRFDPRYHPLARRAHLLAERNIDVILDVGANDGHYADELRSVLGYKGRIVSFEPLSSAYAALSAKAAKDGKWTTVRTALGPESGTATINIAGNSSSSSLLPMAARHVESAPESRYVGAEKVPVTTLDEVFDRYVNPGERAFLKMDVQGFERQVLAGATTTLTKLVGVQLELSLVPLYEGAASYLELCTFLEKQGYRLAALEPGFADPRSGELLQTDAVFFR
jgi:FkbM family methyltransferase